jgi:hypothetical protein
MATIGIDCEIILDGTGYYIKANSYNMRQPRIREMTMRADGGASYVDLGPGKRVWSMTILCLNDLARYDGAATGKTGQQYRDALRTSYSASAGTTINYSDPLNSGPIAVHFDSYSERILDLHAQVIALATGGSLATTYEVSIELVES